MYLLFMYFLLKGIKASIHSAVINLVGENYISNAVREDDDI